jgi:hypothetical protein
MSERAVWGECQGSGANPYQTRVDLSDIAFKCTCPSRKFPCKHGLGLMILLVENSAAFTQTQQPVWVTQWLDDRQQRGEKKAAKKAEEAAKPVDAIAQAKRVEQRKNKVADGVAELDQWLQDLVRQGIASVQSKPYAFWEQMAARLMDAQAPGLARMIRDCGGIPSTGEGWQERLLERLSRIYLIVEAFGRLNSLPEDLQEEIKSLVGFTVNQDELLAKQPSVFDHWEVVGQTVEQEDKLRTQRTWLYGQFNKRWALVLSFAYGTAQLDTGLVPGTWLRAELVFFPGSMQFRALTKTREDKITPLEQLSGTNVTTAFQQYGAALAVNPWIERYPMALRDVVPMTSNGQWCLVDSENMTINLKPGKMTGWQIMALSVGHPIDVFGEWDGFRLTPLAVAAKKEYSRLVTA